jgi:hypothetical protein
MKAKRKTRGMGYLPVGSHCVRPILFARTIKVCGIRKKTFRTASADRQKKFVFNVTLAAEKKAIAHFAISIIRVKQFAKENGWGKFTIFPMRIMKIMNAPDAIRALPAGKPWMGIESIHAWKTVSYVTMAMK